MEDPQEFLEDFFLIKMLMKKLFLFVVVIISFTTIGLFLFLNHPVPAYSGELKVNGIKEEVSVHYDQYAIPHINAKNAHDAYFSLGYIVQY